MAVVVEVKKLKIILNKKQNNKLNRMNIIKIKSRDNLYIVFKEVCLWNRSGKEDNLLSLFLMMS